MKTVLFSLIAVTTISSAIAADPVNLISCTIAVTQQQVQGAGKSATRGAETQEVIFNSVKQSFSNKLSEAASGEEVAFGAATNLPAGKNFVVSANLRFKSSDEVRIELQVSDFKDRLYFVAHNNNPFWLPNELVNDRTVLEITMPFKGKITASAPIGRTVALGGGKSLKYSRMTLECITQ